MSDDNNFEDIFTPTGRSEEFHFGSFPLHTMLKVGHAEKMSDLHLVNTKGNIGDPGFVKSFNEAVGTMRSFEGTNPPRYQQSGSKLLQTSKPFRAKGVRQTALENYTDN